MKMNKQTKQLYVLAIVFGLFIGMGALWFMYSKQAINLDSHYATPFKAAQSNSMKNSSESSTDYGLPRGSVRESSIKKYEGRGYKSY